MRFQTLHLFCIAPHARADGLKLRAGFVLLTCRRVVILAMGVGGV